MRLGEGSALWMGLALSGLCANLWHFRTVVPNACGARHTGRTGASPVRSADPTGLRDPYATLGMEILWHYAADDANPLCGIAVSSSVPVRNIHRRLERAA
jgi:hypothetical protein